MEGGGWGGESHRLIPGYGLGSRCLYLLSHTAKTLTQKITFKNFYFVLVCICVQICIWRSEDNLQQ